MPKRDVRKKVLIFCHWQRTSLNIIKYRKLPKFSDARNFAVIHLKFKQRGQTLRVFCQNGAYGIANSEDPDQTAPRGAV